MATGALHRTAIFDLHREEGARMIGFAGWEMPLQYSGIQQEHLAVRSGAGLFDLSHMGEIEVRGEGALDFVNRLVTSDVSRLEPGRARYTVMCDPEGHILDDLLVYRFPDRFWLVVNASNREKVAAWVRQHLPPGVEVEDRSFRTALLAVQGPRAQEFLQPLTDAELEALPYYHFRKGEVAGRGAVLSRTGYTGEDGFEIYLDWEDGPALWKALRRRPELVPCGLGARDTLRLEAGLALYGHEIHPRANPLESRLGWVVKLDKGEFIGREALSRLRERGLRYTIVGLQMQGRAIPRKGYAVEHQGRAVGEVTSGTWSPVLGRGIAMASVERAVRSPGTLLQVVVRNRREPAVVVPLPFVKGSVRRG